MTYVREYIMRLPKTYPIGTGAYEAFLAGVEVEQVAVSSKLTESEVDFLYDRPVALPREMFNQGIGCHFGNEINPAVLMDCCSNGSMRGIETNLVRLVRAFDSTRNCLST